MTEMDPDTEILLDCSPLFRQYKSGRVERLLGTDVVPAGLDPATGVTSKDVTIGSVPNVSARLYLPKLSDSSQSKLPILIYIHGGGFCIGSAYNPNPFLNSLVARAQLLAVSVDYRLAPEHPLPAAYEDCWAALKWVVSHGSRSGPEPWLTEHADLSRVFLQGESAGANIAHNMAMRAGTEKLDFDSKIEGMVLAHPFFWGTEPIGSEATDPGVRIGISSPWKVVNKAGVEVDHPWFNPMGSGAPELAGLGCGRVMVCVAEKDVLAERGRAYYEALKASQWRGEAELVESEGEDHGFFLKKPECDKALELLVRIVAFLKHNWFHCFLVFSIVLI